MLIVLPVFTLFSCEAKKHRQQLVYKINNSYFYLGRYCVKQLSLREDNALFNQGENLIIVVDNKNTCVKKFSQFISSNIGEKIQVFFKGKEITHPTRIVSAMNFNYGEFYQAVSEPEVARDIINAYENPRDSL